MFRFAARQTARQLRNSPIRAYSTRFASTTTFPKKKILFGGAILAGALVYCQSTSVQLDTKIDGQLLPEESVAVDSSIDPFPIKISADNQHVATDFTLVGHGVRSVTFVGFKVYGIGLYIADADIGLAKSVLGDQKFLASLETENHQLKELLASPVASGLIVAKLLDSGVRFMVRISPVRNTDYGHLKDGLIKSILAHPLSKGQDTREIVGAGLEQLREVFKGRKGSVPKNHLMYLQMLSSGELKVTYTDPQKKTVAVLGDVEEPMIAQVLMLQYLSGKKPLSEPLRKSCIDELATWA
ncbi:chalcone isomerase [Suhomyces tanzawaensis NRRL Y-17324]|uniref:Altered inheritance of mitochondria protein 18, mitochondrial n=1 Tax=Suhomyces tanzawaensis NRRL Y-17324 TaxID=984487 RepID=A0A1E4SMM4_9ASCO|nr:chalcone isomerase [Suhomyces tanzawaensis NRRL Y-17324]ODV80738.1 chalcone isomerase [Suhomyces tanzawaensis NRRL Y-17324]